MPEPPPDQPVSRRWRDTEDCRISDVDLLLDHAAADLTRRFNGTFAYETIRAASPSPTTCSR